MLINDFNIKDASNVPQKMSLTNPFTGETLIDDDDRTLDFFIYGIQSDHGKNAQRARERKYGTGDLKGDRAIQAGAEILAELTQGWGDNIEDATGKIKFTIQGAIELYKAQDWIAAQVMNFARNVENYNPKR